jgi:enamine deaminase RidA (YjgF/YER057c/UK114 family)
MPLGAYTHVLKVPCKTLVFVAGQVPTDAQGHVVGAGEPSKVHRIDLETQLRQVYANLQAGLRAAGADWKDVVRINTYVVHTALNEYREAFFRSGIKNEMMGGMRAPGTVVAVPALMPLEALVEIEVIAALAE